MRTVAASMAGLLLMMAAMFVPGAWLLPVVVAGVSLMLLAGRPVKPSRRVPARRLVASGLPPPLRKLTAGQRDQLIAAFRAAQTAGHQHMAVYDTPPAVVWQGGPHGDQVAWKPLPPCSQVTQADLVAMVNEIAARYGSRPDLAYEQAVDKWNEAQTQADKQAAIEQAARALVEIKHRAADRVLHLDDGSSCDQRLVAGVNICTHGRPAAKETAAPRRPVDAPAMPGLQLSYQPAAVTHSQVCERATTTEVRSSSTRLVVGYICPECWHTARASDRVLARSLWPDQTQIAQASADLARKWAA